MKSLFKLFAAALLITCSAQAANLYVPAYNLVSGPQVNRRVTLTLLDSGPVTAGPWALVGDSVSQFTGVDGTTTFSNILSGGYRLDISGAPPRSFPLTVPSTNGTVTVAQCQGTNFTGLPDYYTVDQVNALVGGAGATIHVAAGTNTTMQTNGTLVTVNANVSHQEVANASNTVLAISLTNNTGLTNLIINRVTTATNDLYGTLGGIINTSSNSLRTRITNATNDLFGTLSGTILTYSNHVDGQFNSTSNSLVGQMNSTGGASTNYVNTRIQNATNDLYGTLGGIIITSSNSLRTRITNATNDLFGTLSGTILTYSNHVDGQFNSTSNTLLSQGNSTANSVSNALNTRVTAATNDLYGTLGGIINTSSNSLRTRITNATNDLFGTLSGTILTYSNHVDGQFNSTSNALVGQMQSNGGASTNYVNTRIQNATNDLSGVLGTSILTSSNSLRTRITNATNDLFGTLSGTILSYSNNVNGQVATTSNGIVAQITSNGGASTNYVNGRVTTATNDLYGTLGGIINTSSNSLRTRITNATNDLFGTLSGTILTYSNHVDGQFNSTSNSIIAQIIAPASRVAFATNSGLATNAITSTTATNALTLQNHPVSDFTAGLVTNVVVISGSGFLGIDGQYTWNGGTVFTQNDDVSFAGTVITNNAPGSFQIKFLTNVELTNTTMTGIYGAVSVFANSTTSVRYYTSADFVPGAITNQQYTADIGGTFKGTTTTSTNALRLATAVTFSNAPAVITNGALLAITSGTNVSQLGGLSNSAAGLNSQNGFRGTQIDIDRTVMNGNTNFLNTTNCVGIHGPVGTTNVIGTYLTNSALGCFTNPTSEFIVLFQNPAWFIQRGGTNFYGSGSLLGPWTNVLNGGALPNPTSTVCVEHDRTGEVETGQLLDPILDLRLSVLSNNIVLIALTNTFLTGTDLTNRTVNVSTVLGASGSTNGQSFNAYGISNAIKPGATIIVDMRGTASGYSNAYTSFQAACNAAIGGQTIKVLPGIYIESTNICILPANVSADIGLGATLMFTPFAGAGGNNANTVAQIELHDNCHLFGGGTIISTPTNAADDSILMGMGRWNQSATNVLIEGLNLSGDVVAFRNLSTNTVDWTVKNCTIKASCAFIQGVSGTSTLTSSNSILRSFNNTIYTTNDTILTSITVRRTYTLGIYGGFIVSQGDRVIRGDQGSAIPSEVFENKTVNVGRWVTNGAQFTDLLIDDSLVTNAVSYDSKVSAGRSFVFRNVARSDGQSLTADPASSPIGITWIPSTSGGMIINSTRGPTLAELTALSGGTNSVAFDGQNGKPTASWTDGATVSSVDISQLAKTNTGAQSMSWGIVSATNLTAGNLTTSNIIGSTLCVPTVVSNYANGLGSGGSATVISTYTTPNSIACDIMIIVGTITGSPINTNLFTLDFGRRITNAFIFSQAQSLQGNTRGIAVVGIANDMGAQTITNGTFNSSGTALSSGTTNWQRVLILGQ